METELCRLCLSSKHSTIEIFGEIGQQLKIAAMLKEHFWFEVQENDELSKVICSSCWTKTSQFHEFYEMIQTIHDQLATIAARVNTVEKDIKIEINLFENSSIEEGPAIDKTNDNSIDVHEYDMNQESIENEEGEDEQEATISAAIKKEMAATVDGTKNIILVENSLSRRNNSEKRRKKRHPKSDEDEENALIRRFFKLECDICGCSCETFLDIKRHYKRTHQMSGHVSCCGRMFLRRSQILKHISLHMKPNLYQCEICEKIFSNKLTLKNHLQNHETEFLEPFKCDICQCTFKKFFKVEQHMRLRHGAVNESHFTCKLCTKKYSTEMALSAHIRGVHECANAHICDICAKVFKSRHSFEIHRMEHLNIKRPRLKCKICGALLKNEQNLRRHLHRHNDKTQTCKICNKIMANKHSLETHIRKVHCERSFQCTMCVKAFKTATALKEHIASHTGESIYTCSYCPRTFKSNGNKHSHRKRAHFDEWLKDRGQRLGSTN